MPLVALTCFLLFANAPALACSCGEPRPVEQAFHDSDLIVVGTVTAIDDQWSAWKRLKQWLGFRYESTGNPAVDALHWGYRVSFRRHRSFKGSAAERFTVFTGRGGGDCGIPFDLGVSYLVYARAVRPGGFYSGICSRGGRADKTIDDLRALELLVLRPNPQPPN
jgi:hypothetical protein